MPLFAQWFPKPRDLKGGDDAYAGFVYLQLDGEKPRFTFGRNGISREVEDIASSSGDVFERKKKELRPQSKESGSPAGFKAPVSLRF